MYVIGDTIREEMRDVGVKNEAHTRDNRKRKKWKVCRIGVV